MSLQRTDASPDEDIAVRIQSEAESAYRPSGSPGNVGVLVVFGALGMVAGLASSLGCVLLALLLNLLHNVLPVFIFIFPLAILGVLAVSPAAYGIAAGVVVKKGSLMAESRSPGLTGGIGIAFAIAGLALFLAGAQAFVGPQKSFSEDFLVPFVRLMIGNAFTFDWASKADPVNVPAWVIHGALGLFALGGLAVAFHVPYERIRSTPYCESCRQYLKPRGLWWTSPMRAVEAAQALEQLDTNALYRLPDCSSFKNKLRLDIWQCSCEQTWFADLVAETYVPPAGDEKRSDVEEARVYSRALTPEQSELVRRARR